MNTKLPALVPRYEELVLQNISESVIITDLSYRVQTWNGVAEMLFGITAAEAIGCHLKELVSFTYHHTTLAEALWELKQNRCWRGKTSFTNLQGKTVFLFQTIKFIQDHNGVDVGIMALAHDITAKQKAEEHLLKSEQFYRNLIADSLDLTLLLDATGNIVFASPSIISLLQYEDAEILHTNAFQYIHPEDLGWAIQSFERELEEKPEIKFIVVRVRKKNGEWLSCMIRGNNLLNNPFINAIVVSIHDDTPRKKATEALQESEKRFRTLIRDLQIGVLLQDAEGSIEMTNHAMCKILDVQEERVLGRKIWEVYTDVTKEDGTRFLPHERPSFKAAQTKQLVKDVVLGVWNETKKERTWILVSADPILDSAGKVINVVCSFTDITERKKMERKSFAEKMAYQRQVAQATIDGQEKERLEIGKELHDNIGQQLTTIKLFLDLAKTTADDKTLERVNLALRGVTDVINEVRSISRSLVPPTLKDLGFIDSVNDLFDSIRTTQSLSIFFDDDGFNEDQLPDNKKLALFRIIQEQLNNIIKHACARQVYIKLRLRQGNILLQIKDDGIGFDKAKVRKGLGLININNRAELFGGSTVLETSPGKGCDIKVSLPHSGGLVTAG